MDPHTHCTLAHGKLRRPCPQGVNKPQPGPDAALGIIVVPLRVAKIGHHGVTEILPNHPLQSVDDLGTGGVEGPHQGLDLFQVAVGSQRVDQRAPEHCQGAAFGNRSSTVRHGRRCRQRVGRSRLGEWHCDAGSPRWHFPSSEGGGYGSPEGLRRARLAVPRASRGRTHRRLLLHRRHKAIATTAHGLHQLGHGAAIPERFADLHDTGGQRRLLDKLPGPHLLQQFLLRHHAVPMHQQVGQHRKRFGAQRLRPARPLQLIP
jgi:hypothetical protein